jgi:hypothetical protein
MRDLPVTPIWVISASNLGHFQRCHAFSRVDIFASLFWRGFCRLTGEGTARAANESRRKNTGNVFGVMRHSAGRLMMRKRASIAERRARLVVQCAKELLAGQQPPPESSCLRLDMSVREFEQELHQRYALLHPELVLRSEASIERARLARESLQGLPRVQLRLGAPRGKRRPRQ